MAEDRLVILLNDNANMSRGKSAAAAVHAALYFHGIEHGAVVVLTASPTEIREQCDVLIHDAGRTEVAPLTLTAGARRNAPTGVS